MIFEARDIRHFYGDVCALDGVSFAVEHGQRVTIRPHRADLPTPLSARTAARYHSSGG